MAGDVIGHRLLKSRREHAALLLQDGASAPLCGEIIPRNRRAVGGPFMCFWRQLEPPPT